MSKEPLDTLSAGNIAGGAVIEALDYELQRALDNIIDPNTKAKAARTVTLQIKLMPNDERNKATVSFIAKAALQPAQAVETDVYIFDQKGHAIASEAIAPDMPKQADLPGVTRIAAVGGIKE